MAESNEEFRQALMAFYKAAVTFARRDDDHQEEEKRKGYVRDQLKSIQQVFTDDWRLQASSQPTGCIPECPEGWVCINNDCFVLTAYESVDESPQIPPNQ